MSCSLSPFAEKGLWRPPERLRDLLVILLLALPVWGQSTPQVLWTGGWALSGPVGQRGAVRDASGNLFCIVIDRGGGTQDALTLLRSTDAGQTWSVFLTPINDGTSGLTGANRTNQAVIAIDDQDRLHVSWQRAWYPSVYEQFYRNVDLASGASSSILNVNSLLGVPLTARSNAQALHVASDGRVWMTGPTASNWQEQLLVSSQPYAASGTFTSVGNVAPPGQGQNARLAFDASGNIHAIYYTLASIRHRFHDPITGTWSPVSTVAPHGGGSMARAFDLRADILGGVHAIAMVNTTPTSGAVNPELRYSRWDASGGWGNGSVLASWTQTQITASDGNLHNMRVAGLAVNEVTGDVFVAMRDFGAGAGSLVIVRKLGGASTFHRTLTLTPPSQARDVYYAPYFIGHENPLTSLTLSDLQVFWRRGAAGGQFSAWHASHPGAPLAVSVPLGSGCSGTSPVPLSLLAPPPIIGDASWMASITGGPPNGSAFVYTTLVPAVPAILVGGGCAIHLDLTQLTLGSPTLGPVPLGPLGELSLPVPLPQDPALAGFRLTAQALVPDPGGAPLGLVLSNGLDLFFGY